MKKILLLLFALLLPSYVVANTSKDSDNVQFCLAKDSNWSTNRHLSYMKVLGVECATLYYNINSRFNIANPFKIVNEPYLEDGHDVVVVLIFSKKKNVRADLSLIEQVNMGLFDDELDRLVSSIKKVGKTVIIRPFHEIDASWHKWGMYNRKVGNTVEKASLAFVRVAKKLKQAGDLVKIDINLNRRDGRGRVLGDIERYIKEVEPVVDMFSISSYNRCKINEQKKNRYERSFQYEFKPPYEVLRKYTKKPINVAETSTSGLCTKGEKLPWFNRLLYDLKEKFPATKMVTLYFGYKDIGTASNTVPVDWGLTPADRPKFRRMLQKYWPDRYSEINDKSFIEPLNWSAPWSAYISGRNTLYQEPNPALNPLSKEEFGVDEFLFMSQFKQSLLYRLSNNVTVGPVLRVGLIDSNNDNRWWSNSAYYGAGLGLYYDLPKDFFLWGKLSLEIGATKYEYTVAHPDSLKNDWRSMVSLSLSGGGDWLQ